MKIGARKCKLFIREFCFYCLIFSYFAKLKVKKEEKKEEKGKKRGEKEKKGGKKGNLKTAVARLLAIAQRPARSMLILARSTTV